MKISKKKNPNPVLDVETGLPQTAPENRSLLQDPFVHILFILVTGFACYFNSINVPFSFDDFGYLINNPAIKNFDCFPDTRKVFDYSIFQDNKNNLILRPVTYFTFAVNYALHGLDLFGYHMVNLLIHMGCGMLVYYLFVQLLRSPAMAAEAASGNAASDVDSSGYLPLFAALLFVCHPLQTQAVTYIIQRFVPLATFFYLASLVFYMQFRCSRTLTSSITTYLLSFASAVLAMESKEIAFTLPLIIILVEFMFFRANLLQRVVRVMPFVLTMAIIPAKLLYLSSEATPDKSESTSSAINLVNFAGTSSWDYLMTQFGVITTYIRLLILPIGQNPDYDYPLQQNFFKLEVLLPLALLLVILATGFYLLSRAADNRLNKIIAFGIFWFFITLSVESSIVPIDDLILEHRAYLPSIGFFTTCIAGSSIVCSRLTLKSMYQSKIATFVLLILFLAYLTATIARNRAWQDNISFLEDIARKSPNKARVHRTLGIALVQQAKYVPDENEQAVTGDIVLLKKGGEEQISAAVNAFKKAILLEPENFNNHLNLTEALILQKNYDEALQSLSTAAKLQPGSAIPYVMHGDLYAVQNDLTQARQQYLEAVRIQPSSHVSHLKLADLYVREGNLHAAIKELELVMKIHPDDKVLNNLNRLRAYQK